MEKIEQDMETVVYKGMQEQLQIEQFSVGAGLQESKSGSQGVGETER